MLLYIMPYIILAYLMLFAALFNAVCLCNVYLFFAIEVCFYAMYLFIDTWLTYFKYYFASCTMLLSLGYLNFMITPFF